jgi:hypothetical protein
MGSRRFMISGSVALVLSFPCVIFGSILVGNPLYRNWSVLSVFSAFLLLAFVLLIVRGSFPHDQKRIVSLWLAVGLWYTIASGLMVPTGAGGKALLYAPAFVIAAVALLLARKITPPNSNEFLL